MMDELAEVIELLANLSPEDRRAVLRHFHDEVRSALVEEEGYLSGGGMNSGSMVVTETAPEREARRATPPRFGATTPLFP